MEPIITIALSALVVYLVLGVLFAIPFLTKWMQTLDPGTRGASIGFKLTILPGVILLWIYLLIKWLKK